MPNDHISTAQITRDRLTSKSDSDTKRRSNCEIALKLVKLVKPLAGYMILAIVLGVLGFLTAIFIPVMGTYILLEIVGFAVPLPFATMIALLIVCAITRGFLRYGEQLCNHYIAFKLLALIRDKVFRALRRLAPAKLETRDKGNLITVLTSDIELLEVFYAHTISPIVIAVISSAIMLIFIGMIDPIFALIALCAYLVVGLLIPLVTSRAGRDLGLDYRSRSGKLSSYLLDSLRGLKEVSQYRQGENRLRGIRSQTRALSEEQARLKRIEGLSAAATTTAIMLFALGMLGAGITLYQTGSTEASSVIIAFVSLISSFGPVVALSNLANNLVHTFASGNRVLDILEEQPVTEEVVGQVPLASYNGITCEQVDFSYNEEPILAGFDLKVQAGQTIGISGKSGSGKSTLLRLMMRFWDVKGGTIKISDVDLKETNTTDLRDNQSFVTQETLIFDDTIASNIRIGKLDATDEEVVTACKKAALHDFIATLPKAYDTPVGELGDALSGGERQRIGLARAFLHDAPLMFLDEPTSNLDSLNEGIILESLRDQTQGKTVILVSHRLSSMAFADEIVPISSKRVS